MTPLAGGVDDPGAVGVIEVVGRYGDDMANKTWTNCDEYVAALEALPLGPNLAAFPREHVIAAVDATCAPQ